MSLKSDFRELVSGRDWRGRSRTPRSAVQYREPSPGLTFPTAWTRSKPARTVRRGLHSGVLKPLVWAQTRPTVEGTEYLDGLTGPVIFAANHASHLDAPLILNTLPKHFAGRVAVGAAADYFFTARWRAVLTTLAFNAFPVERFGGSSKQKQASLAPELLDRGWSLLLFPEASRSQDGWMSPFRIGAAFLAWSRKVPVVPVAMRGTYAAMPRGEWAITRGRPSLVVRYGRPMLPHEGEPARDFNVRVADAVHRLWAEEDLGWYRALRESHAGRIERPAGPQGAPWRRLWEATRPLRSSSRPNRIWS
ncbi:lysophospholipid acyltransferase family protein [Catellatospora bangladeshensis]|uniref:Phospholipid/glycerol acyltransferase domain-containing protein n=1 Tax=Catellatospora bangladeshensis TaxID=310355 RepID=A0A8J3JEV6_9ACTN|nr:lysophospholipid acyltransferase family protein [Catellatospora bangladeshensis]GIF83672.1 hypothetical protein Cba03nite_50210 [Catellatospora bangladeshensis]